MIPFWGTTKNDKAAKSQQRMFHKGLSKLADKMPTHLRPFRVIDTAEI